MLSRGAYYTLSIIRSLAVLFFFSFSILIFSKFFVRSSEHVRTSAISISMSFPFPLRVSLPFPCSAYLYITLISRLFVLACLLACLPFFSRVRLWFRFRFPASIVLLSCRRGRLYFRIRGPIHNSFVLFSFFHFRPSSFQRRLITDIYLSVPARLVVHSLVVHIVLPCTCTPYVVTTRRHAHAYSTHT